MVENWSIAMSEEPYEELIRKSVAKAAEKLRKMRIRKKKNQRNKKKKGKK